MKKLMTRKEFLKVMGVGIPAIFCASNGYALFNKQNCDKDIKGHIFKNDAPSKPWKWSIEGFHYESIGDDVQCMICPNHCYLSPGDRSVCRSKVNIDGKLYSLTYGNPCSVHVDPIVKKPLYHFFPNTFIFSVATTGCNLRCLNCQNWEISQKKPEEIWSERMTDFEMFPLDVVRAAQERKAPSIAYTYSEAITFYEYMYDIAKLARKARLKNVIVSNGYINYDPLIELTKYLDGAAINLKSFDDCIYRKLNGGTLQPVLDTLKTLHEEDVWFEIITLVVPTYIDDPEMIRKMCRWIVDELGPDHPLHFTRFFPLYKLTRLPYTPVATLEKFREIALEEGIHYVYVGNVPGHPGNDTYCHNCGRMIIHRLGYSSQMIGIEKERCTFCQTKIPGRWN